MVMGTDKSHSDRGREGVSMWRRKRSQNWFKKKKKNKCSPDTGALLSFLHLPLQIFKVQNQSCSLAPATTASQTGHLLLTFTFFFFFLYIKSPSFLFNKTVVLLLKVRFLSFFFFFYIIQQANYVHFCIVLHPHLCILWCMWNVGLFH